jgi:hypothetical protein
MYKPGSNTLMMVSSWTWELLTEVRVIVVCVCGGGGA